MADQRQIEAILQAIKDEREELIDYSEFLLDEMGDEADNEIMARLQEDYDDTLQDIEDLDRDIAMYQEVLNDLIGSVVGACGFPCDGNCSLCGGGYDHAYEVFAAGDY